MKTFAAFALLFLAGCAFQPLVDQPGPTYGQDLAECRAHAQQTAGPGTTAAAGAVIGFGLGYVICRTLGGRDCSSTGRATGIVGAASGGGAGYQQEAQVVRACLAGRGYRVLN